MLHIASCCALLAQADIHVPAGMQWVQHYRRDMLMFVAMRKIHFDYISDIKFWSKAIFGCRKRILLLCVMDCILERSDLSMHFATRCDEIASCRECMRNATSPRWSCRGDGDGRTHNSRAHRVEREVAGLYESFRAVNMVDGLPRAPSLAQFGKWQKLKKSVTKMTRRALPALRVIRLSEEIRPQLGCQKVG